MKRKILEKLVDHVQAKVEDKFWEQDGLHEQYLDEFIIRVTESDSCEEESSEESVVIRVLPVMNNSRFHHYNHLFHALYF